MVSASRTNPAAVLLQEEPAEPQDQALRADPRAEARDQGSLRPVRHRRLKEDGPQGAEDRLPRAGLRALPAGDQKPGGRVRARRHGRD